MVVNNGAVEEVSDKQVRDQMEVNFFGVLNVTQAVLPQFRKQGSGHLIQVTSMGGVMAFPNLGGYHASKWAVEGLTESLVQEVSKFGIKVTLVEPGGYETDWAGASAVHAAPLPQYDFHPARHDGYGRADAGEFRGQPRCDRPCDPQTC